MFLDSRCMQQGGILCWRTMGTPTEGNAYWRNDRHQLGYLPHRISSFWFYLSLKTSWATVLNELGLKLCVMISCALLASLIIELCDSFCFFNCFKSKDDGNQTVCFVRQEHHQLSNLLPSAIGQHLAQQNTAKGWMGEPIISEHC